MMIPEISSDAAAAETGLSHRCVLQKDPTAPLVLLVHGRAGNSEVMWAFRRAFPEGCSFIAPQAFLPDPLGGWSWWDISENTSNAIGTAISRLDGFIEKALAFYGLAPRSLVAAGFSQGAGLLSALMQERPTRFVGVALLAGFVLKKPGVVPLQGDIDSIVPAEGMPKVFVGHGELDPVIPLERCLEGVEFLRRTGFPVELQVDQVTHKVGSAAGKALKVWAHRLLESS